MKLKVQQIVTLLGCHSLKKIDRIVSRKFKLSSLRPNLGKIFRTINISDLFPMTILYFKVSQEALSVECKLVLSTK